MGPNPTRATDSFIQELGAELSGQRPAEECTALARDGALVTILLRLSVIKHDLALRQVW